jgi:outer membrane receptor protein involved in Fe transport
VLLLLAIYPAASSAQTYRGTILGTVSDASGATVPGAKVTVRNVATGLTRETTTADDGTFSVPELPIGTYTVTVEKTGFQTSVTSGARVEVAGERRVDVTLKPGEVAQRVEVSAETLAVVDTITNALGGSIESKTVESLPLNGRDFTKLLIMVPGAVGEPNGGGDSPGSYGLFSVNGNRGRSNNFLLDGTDMNDGFRNLPAINQGGVFGTPGTVLPVESMAEVRILSNFEPEYGRNSGSVVNIVTKSGTNDFHGSASWFFRDDALNARNFFNTRPNPKDAFRNHQYGVSAGGPFRRDRTFWYVAYEGQREDVGVTSVNSVPTFTPLPGTPPDPTVDYVAAIGAIGGNPALCTTTIIACLNAQAPGIVNPVILNLFNRCNTNGGCSGDRDVWPTSTVSSAPAFNDADSFIVKLDHNFTGSHTLTGRYFYGQSDQSFPLGVGGGNNLPNTNTFSPINAQFLAVSYVHVISSNKVNETRFGWNRYKQDFFAADRAVFGNPSTSIGLNTEVSDPRDFGLPTIRIPGLSALGSSAFSNPKGRVGNNWQIIDGFSWKIGSHDWKFGAEYRRTTVKSFFNIQNRGILSFGSLADFLAGNVGGGRRVFGNSDRRSFQNSFGFYVQDSYRWSSKFTVNLGLRWDYYGIIGEDEDRFSVYEPSDPDGDGFGLHTTGQLYPKDWNNLSPRVSFAYDFTGLGKTVLRGGFAMFYDSFSHDFFTGQIPFNCFSCPGVAYNPVGPDPVFVSLTTVGTLAPGVAVYDVVNNGPSDTTDVFSVDRLRTPYVMTYNLNIQQELFGRSVLQIGYVGTGGRKLFRYRDINQPTAAAIRAYDYATSGCCVPRPFDSAAPLSAAAPNQPFYVNQLESSANSNYHSLQVSFQQRNWHGLTQQWAWTWSHSIDNASDGQDFVPNASQPNDSQIPDGERGNSNFDTRHRLVWSFTYDFPRWEAAGRFGEGWQISSIVTLMSGHPFHINYNFIDDYDGSGQFFPRPDVIAPVRYNRSNPAQFLDLSSFRVPCTLDGIGTFAQNCVFAAGVNSMHFGSLGRNALLGPDYRNWDFAISKVTRLTERISVNLRFDFFNLLNHPNFANPFVPAFFADAAPCGIGLNGIALPCSGSTPYLAITSTSDIGLGNPFLGGGGPRSMQFAVKVVW